MEVLYVNVALAHTEYIFSVHSEETRIPDGHIFFHVTEYVL